MGFLLCALPGRAAWAGDNDIVLSRLGQMVNGAVVGNGADFRSLMSELGVVHAPRLLSPADTLGFGGFQFTTDLGLTSVVTMSCIVLYLVSLALDPGGVDADEFVVSLCEGAYTVAEVPGEVHDLYRGCEQDGSARTDQQSI